MLMISVINQLANFRPNKTGKKNTELVELEHMKVNVDDEINKLAF